MLSMRCGNLSQVCSQVSSYSRGTLIDNVTLESDVKFRHGPSRGRMFKNSEGGGAHDLNPLNYTQQTVCCLLL